MSTKNTRDQKPAARKPAKGEIKESELDKVGGGMAVGGLPTGKRPLTFSGDPCEGGE